MALCNCIECGKEVSSKAKVCPFCGIDKPKGSFKKNLGLFIFAIIVLGFFYYESFKLGYPQELLRWFSS